MALALNPSVLGLNVSGDLDGYTIYTNRKGKKVSFAQAPPRKPLSVWQLAWQRNFRWGMALWKSLSAAERANYRRVCDLARLCMLGHNLFLHSYLAADFALLDTLECHYRIPLRRPPPL
jgi:hypothetical protein